MPAWPSTLPSPSAAQYGVTRASVLARTDFESGPARVRRRYTAEIRQVSLQWTMTDSQLAELALFWSVVEHGAAWFDIPLLLEDGERARSARFVNPPEQQFLSPGLWRVSAALEIRPE